MINLYWPEYKNLEREVVFLSNEIHFDDNQLSVYSVKISELLLRCVVEIEAIAKELYKKNGGENPEGRDLYFDTDCLNLLEKKWMLSKKVVITSSVNFYFQQEENKVLTPLKRANKRGTSSADWKRAYQAVKHNRTLNLKKGNFSNNFSELFDNRVHSWIGTNYSGNPYVKNEDFEKCIYLIKWTNQYKEKWTKFSDEHQKNLNEIIINHSKVKQYINNNIIENGQINKKEYSNMINTAMNKASKKLSYDMNKPTSFEAILNMNQRIYATEDSEELKK